MFFLCRFRLKRTVIFGKMRYLLLLLLLPLLTKSQEEDDYVNDNVMRYDDYVYKPNIRTVQFHLTTWEYGVPVIGLNNGEQLELSFDDLDGDQKLYTFSFVHCNADWTPSDLMVSEYLNGYYELNIQDFSYSVNTFQKYTHYSVIFPQQNNIRFTKSGNYILYVYRFGDKQDLVLTRRMMVYDDRLQIGATFRQTVGGDDQFKKQQIDFTINAGSYNLTNPFRDMTVVITQNNRWDNAAVNLKPTFMNGNQLVFSLDAATAFNGGNEFRYFDTRSTRFLTERVKEFYRDEQMRLHAVLQPDELRITKPYLYYPDFNGNFVIRNREAIGDMDTEADYINVHFFLPYKTPESGGNFYILGKLTDWRMNNRSKLTYNYEKQGYEATLFLKQGFYNYIYVLSDDKKKGGDHSITEGNHWDTENDYNIYVYHRKFGTYYDQLLAYKKLNSLRN